MLTGKLPLTVPVANWITGRHCSRWPAEDWQNFEWRMLWQCPRVSHDGARHSALQSLQCVLHVTLYTHDSDAIPHVAESLCFGRTLLPVAQWVAEAIRGHTPQQRLRISDGARPPGSTADSGVLNISAYLCCARCALPCCVCRAVRAGHRVKPTRPGLTHRPAPLRSDRRFRHRAPPSANPETGKAMPAAAQHGTRECEASGSEALQVRSGAAQGIRSPIPQWWSERSHGRARAATPPFPRPSPLAVRTFVRACSGRRCWCPRSPLVARLR